MRETPKAKGTGIKTFSKNPMDTWAIRREVVSDPSETERSASLILLRMVIQSRPQQKWLGKPRVVREATAERRVSSSLTSRISEPNFRSYRFNSV